MLIHSKILVDVPMTMTAAASLSVTKPIPSVTKPATNKGSTGGLLLSEQQVVEYKEAFDLFDKNKDGFISIQELATVMKSLGQTPTEGDLAEMIREVDADGSGTIDFDEFQTMMIRKFKDVDSDDDLKVAFALFDVNHDGFITSDELKNGMSSLGEQLTDEEVTEMIQQADLDGDGRLNLADFIAMMRASSS